jgi:hypothetical protein
MCVCSCVVICVVTPCTARMKPTKCLSFIFITSQQHLDRSPLPENQLLMREAVDIVLNHACRTMDDGRRKVRESQTPLYGSSSCVSVHKSERPLARFPGSGIPIPDRCVSRQFRDDTRAGLPQTPCRSMHLRARMLVTCSLL